MCLHAFYSVNKELSENSIFVLFSLHCSLRKPNELKNKITDSVLFKDLSVFFSCRCEMVDQHDRIGETEELSSVS